MGVDLKEKKRCLIEIIIIILIILSSIVIFLFRDRFDNIGTIGYLGLFLLCFLANSTVFLPSPSLMIVASCALILNPLLVAVVGSLGSSLGEFMGYFFGVASKNVSLRMQNMFELLKKHVNKPIVLVFILALLPLPLFDVAGVYAGGTKVNGIKFFAACYLGKFIKMLFYAYFYNKLNDVISMINI